MLHETDKQTTGLLKAEFKAQGVVKTVKPKPATDLDKNGYIESVAISLELSVAEMIECKLEHAINARRAISHNLALARDSGDFERITTWRNLYHSQLRRIGQLENDLAHAKKKGV